MEAHLSCCSGLFELPKAWHEPPHRSAVSCVTKKWVQPEEAIENPYMGKAMLQCGGGSDWKT
jgi:hypothetical protein